jgi:hypothetical protein
VSVNLDTSQLPKGISENGVGSVNLRKLEVATTIQKKADIALFGVAGLTFILYLLYEFAGVWSAFFKVSGFVAGGFTFAVLMAWGGVNTEFTQMLRAKYLADGFSPPNARKHYYRNYPLHRLPHLFQKRSLLYDTQWTFNH